ncbi:MAG TPA: hypothetical protein VIV11_04390 [Kofleriaceae bacterium]
MTKHTLTTLFLSTSVLISATSAALAETSNTLRTDAMPAIDGGLEIAVVASSTASVGEIGGDMADAQDLLGLAGGVELHVGHRLTPNLAVGFYSTAQGLSEGSAANGRDIYGGTAGLEANFHARPAHAVDPWISIGSGLRGLWIQDETDSVLIGVELMRLQLGVDFRLNPDFSVGPVIGASTSFYAAQRLPMQEFEEIDDKGINWTVTAGVMARFNTFGTRN